MSGCALRAWRVARVRTVAALAHYAAVPHAVVCALERGTLRADYETAERIVHALGVHLRDVREFRHLHAMVAAEPMPVFVPDDAAPIVRAFARWWNADGKRAWVGELAAFRRALCAAAEDLGLADGVPTAAQAFGHRIALLRRALLPYGLGVRRHRRNVPRLLEVAPLAELAGALLPYEPVPGYVTVTEAARRLGVTRRRLNGLIARGVVPTLFIGARRLVPLEALAAPEPQLASAGRAALSQGD
ncbi:MAG: hypothetical protein NZ761_04355 [Dehalococcoidia bacterium]|nr:hypothetical protein [Dehalococcoidia bacterium]